MALFLIGLLASGLSFANDRSMTTETCTQTSDTSESGEDYMSRMYDEGIFVDPAEPDGPIDPGVQAAVKICVDGSDFCLETDSYTDCNDWKASYEDEGPPSGISCYDLI